MSKVSYQYSFVLFLLLCWSFFIKKSLLWQHPSHDLNGMLFPHILCVFFIFSQYEVYIFVVIRLGRGLFCAYSRSHMAQFKHTLWSNKHCVNNCVPHYLLHRSGNSEAYFFIYVYETASYVLWIRNTRSTVELWLHDQNETLRLCVNKMLCWKHFTMNYMKVKNLSGKLIHRWRWYRWWLWTGECKWQ